MHVESMDEMRKVLTDYLEEETELSILDVGSMTVKNKGSYKQLMKPGWKYTGLDVEEGPNVDIVAPIPYVFPITTEIFDCVISGQCFEHVKNPFELMAECSRVLKEDGLIFVVAPFKFKQHRFPVDCWRFLPDGWAALFEESDITMLESYFVDNYQGSFASDCWAIGRKQ